MISCCLHLFTSNIFCLFKASFLVDFSEFADVCYRCPAPMLLEYLNTIK